MSTIDPQVREEQSLAPYAMRSRDSQGREHSDRPDSYRTSYQRDRDRVIHSTAFRRLEYKTQVFVNHEGDHYRTRLTHTLEVAQISRSVARALGLNEDLVEAIALSHDLGHPPFGHAGEERLNQLMQQHGGFNHNLHSLRVVDHLESRYPDFSGLNLSWEVRESIVKHYGRFDRPELAQFDSSTQPLLEAQLADIGDSLAYNSHDLDDGLRSGYLELGDLRQLELWCLAEEKVREIWPQISDRDLVSRTVSKLIDAQVQDLIRTTLEQLREHRVGSVENVRQHGRLLVTFSPSMAALKQELQCYLRENLYRHPRTTMIAEKGKRFLEAIFCEYQRAPQQLPNHYRQRLEREKTELVICDYLAGMTDRYCLQEYMRLFVPFADGSIAGSL